MITIVVDPPWPDQGRGPDWGSSGASKSIHDYYPTMTIDAIKDLSVIKDLKEFKHAHLYLWTCNRYIVDAYEVAKAWGFKPSCLLTWCKPPMGIGLGGTYVQTTEYMLFCRRGTLTAKKRIDRTHFNWPRGRHSQKPAESFKMIEEVSPGPYLELFARNKRDGWESWGNEV